MKLFKWALLWAIAGCSNTEETKQAAASFSEPFRPQFHFTPPANWMNDPNGMVYLNGEYHLFYQHNPNDKVWGPMHWGHAISTDLVHWEHLPIALYPDSLGTIFSGSAVYDRNNTSGLGIPGQPPLIAIYTNHDGARAEAGQVDFQTQSIAYSTDKGRTWNKYENNPVLPNPGIRDFRDPKVHWHEPSQQWVMALAVQDVIHFYSSPNLIDWKLESTFGKNIGAKSGVWECPDLFPIQDPSGADRYALLVSINPGGPNMGSATQYFLGDFDGHIFTPIDSTVRWLDYGPDNYAGVTWSNIPETDGRRLFIGWMSNWQYANATPTDPWRSAMTLPRALEWVGEEGLHLLRSTPIAALKKLRTSRPLKAEMDKKVAIGTGTFEIVIQKGKVQTVTLGNNQNERAIIQVLSNQIVLDRTQAGISDFHPEFARSVTAPLDGLEVDKLILYVDHSSIEVFVNDGRIVLTARVFPQEPYQWVSIQGAEGIVYPLKASTSP